MKLPPLAALTPRHWLIIIAVATVAISGLFIFLAWRVLQRLGPDPGMPALLQRFAGAGEQTLFAQIAAAEAEIARQEGEAARYPERKALLESMQNDIAAARRRLPSEAQKPEMAQLIYDLARQVQGGPGGFTIVSLTITESASEARGKRQNYQTVVYQVQVTSDIDGIIHFINLVERSDRFMTIEGIQITSGGVHSDRETGAIEYKPHTAQLRIVTYVDTSANEPGPRRS
ncbi:MAG: type 4a pilus biogenesis protein PilO [Planctomycetota bacterium]|nr:type 4a pilus biogenesis protein PilO [Planctomycetota bacterium]MCX8040586.1 type 4a pilus biogenesis protein PilO [Planctomycetota bacterium]MDW8373058.1 type 4a pilus biogenesis protein PilO [Planctomycetota bacterium]